MRVLTRSGKEYLRKMDIAPGFPGNELTKEDHRRRFRDCMEFAGKPVPREDRERLVSLIDGLEKLEDIRTMIPLLLSDAQ
jgi:hypothetical protein